MLSQIGGPGLGEAPVVPPLCLRDAETDRLSRDRFALGIGEPVSGLSVHLLELVQLGVGLGASTGQEREPARSGEGEYEAGLADMPDGPAPPNGEMNRDDRMDWEGKAATELGVTG